MGLGNNNNNEESSSGGGGSSRKNKKSNNNNNNNVPKLPQRGLGVAQLEKIRVHTEIGNSSSSSTHHPFPFQNHYLPPNNLSQVDRRIQTPYSSSASASASSYSYSAVQSSSPPPYGFHGNPSIVMGMSDIERANIGYANSSQLGHRRWSASNAIFDQRPEQSDMTRHLFNLQVEDSSRQRSEDEREEEEEVDLELRLSFKSQ